uniref:Biorientation of chromosomes in cell division 1 like 1 n=1 Tax=Ornithorhynchus anatinus TaxID=9258 RepID=F6PS92_ORNAN
MCCLTLGKNNVDLEESSRKLLEPKATRTKEVLKERRVLEKKVALSKKRKKDSRPNEESCKKKYHSEEESKEALKINEHSEKLPTSKEPKHIHAKSEPSKPARRLSESLHTTDENRSESKTEREHRRRASTSLEGAQPDPDIKEAKRQMERPEINPEETQKPKSILKNEKHPKKDNNDSEMHLRSIPKKELRSYREKSEKERTLSEDKLSTKHKYKGDSVHKIGDETELHPSERNSKADESGQKQSQQIKVSSDDKADKKSKHRNEKKIPVLTKDGKTVSENTLKTEESLRKENSKKDRHLSVEKARSEHKSRRASDSKVQKDSQGLKQHSYTSQRRSESYSEDKCDAESTNSEHFKAEDNVHRDRRRTKSLLEEKGVLKSKSKSHSKPSRGGDVELQESATKQEPSQKSDREKNVEESDTDKPRKPKNEEKPSEETSVESEFESTSYSGCSSQKDSSYRVKLPAGEKTLVKDKHKSDKDFSVSKVERKLSVDSHKSRSSKHSSKETKRKEENVKSEEKESKEVDTSHEKVKGNSVVMEKKSSKRLCENRRGSPSSQEMIKTEDKVATGSVLTAQNPLTQRQRKSGENSSVPDQEPMEVDAEQAFENTPASSRTQDKNNSDPKPDVDSDNTSKLKTSLQISRSELRNNPGDFQVVDSAHKPECHFRTESNSEKNTEHKNVPIKEPNVPVSKKEKESIQQGAFQISLSCDTSNRGLLNTPSENARTQKNLKSPAISSEESVSLSSSFHQGGGALKHSVNTNSSESVAREVTVPQKESRHLDKPGVMESKTALESKTVHPSGTDLSESPRTSSDIKEHKVIQSSSNKEENRKGIITAKPAKESLAPVRSIPDCDQRRDEANLTADTVAKDEALSPKEFVSMESDKEAKDGSVPGISFEQGMRANVDAEEKEEESDPGSVIGTSTEKEASPLEFPEKAIRSTVTKTEEAAIEKGNESSEVGTSAGRGGVPVIQSREQTASHTSIGTSSEEKASTAGVATSTEGKDDSLRSCAVKSSDATTTSTVTEEREVSLACTSIEADEGFTTGSCAELGHAGTRAEADDSTVVAAAEEGGGVTEGFAESETLLTSTKEGVSGECSAANTEESSKDAGGVHTVEDVNSAGTEEKDDAVTSAGSEEKCEGSSSGDSGVVGTVTCVSEVESDGAVTSAGTEVLEGSLSGEDADGCQRSLPRTSQKKETEGAVTCTGAEERSSNFAICSVTGADAQGEDTVTGASVAVVGDDSIMGTSSNQEGEDSTNDGAEGESAVTSTGITEEEGEGTTSCTGSEESSEGFAVCSEPEENGESPMDSTVVKDVINLSLSTVGPCDDEGIVTSTGAKEEDEEDEGMVSSTGRGNEIGSASTCVGIEEGEGALACLSAEEDENLIGTAAEHVESEAGVLSAVNINGSDSVDSMSGAEKEVRAGVICSSAKEVVESSVTSASVESALMVDSEKPEGVPILAGVEESEGPVTTDKSDSQVSPEEKEEDATISTGLMENDGVLRSEAAPEGQVPLIPADGKEDEQAITSGENKDGGGLLATAAPESGPGKESKGKTLMISTSTADGYRVPLLSSAGEAKEGHCSGTGAEGGGEGPVISVEIEAFEVPTPSAATEAEAQLGVAGKEKDECAMISTSIVEEFEAPMSSAALENEEMPPPVATTEEVQGDTLSEEAEDYEAPMSSAVTELQSQLASTSKEEKDECALISTSIVEECEAPVSSEVTEGKEEYRATGRGEKGGSSMISTSSMRDCEGPVSSAIPRGEGHLPATTGEEANDTAMISTSTTGDCEVIVTGPLPQSELPLAATTMEEISDASVISTSTNEEGTPVMTSVDRRKTIQLVGLGAEEKDEGATISAGKGGACDIPMPSVIAVNEEGHSAGSVTDDRGGGSEISASLEENEGPSTYTPAGEKAQLAVASSEGKDESGQLAEDVSKATPFSGRGENNSLGIVNVGDPSDPGEEGEKKEEKKEGHKASSSGRLESAAGSEAAENRLAVLSGSEEVSGNVKSDSVLIDCHSAAASSAEDKAADEQVAKVISLEPSSIVCEETWHDENLSTKNEKRTSGSGPQIDTRRSRTPPGGDEPPLLTSECETKVTVNSDHNENLIFEATVEKSDSCTDGPQKSDDTKKSVGVEGDPVINVSSENTVCNAGNEETLPEGLEELELKTNLKTESPVPSGEEKDRFEEPPEDLCGNRGNALAEPGKNPAEVKESNAQTLDPQTNEEIHSCKEKAKSLEDSQDVKEYVPCKKTHIQEAVRCPTPKRKLEEVEISSQEEENQPPERKRKKHTLSDKDDFEVPDSKREDRQSHCSEGSPQVLQEGRYENTEEISQESVKKSSTVSEIVGEKGEFIIMETIGEKAEQSEDAGVKALEEDQPVIVKRKRGRPRKYPLEDALKTKEDSKTEAAVVNTQQSPSGGKGKITATDDSHKEINPQERNLASDDGEDKTVVVVRRRGRKPRRSFTLSEETETSEPERKRQKSVSEGMEDKKEPESGEEEEEEEDEEDDEKHLRATTRSASRLEAQRRQPSKPTTRAASKLSSPETASPRNRQKLSKEKLSTTEKVSKSPPLGR